MKSWPSYRGRSPFYCYFWFWFIKRLRIFESIQSIDQPFLFFLIFKYVVSYWSPRRFTFKILNFPHQKFKLLISAFLIIGRIEVSHFLIDCSRGEDWFFIITVSKSHSWRADLSFPSLVESNSVSRGEWVSSLLWNIKDIHLNWKSYN